MKLKGENWNRLITAMVESKRRKGPEGLVQKVKGRKWANDIDIEISAGAACGLVVYGRGWKSKPWQD